MTPETVCCVLLCTFEFYTV